MRYSLLQACEQAGIDRLTVVHCLRARWLIPAFPEDAELNDADLARLRLIVALREDFGVNDEAVPLILHLVDQLRNTN